MPSSSAARLRLPPVRRSASLISRRSSGSTWSARRRVAACRSVGPPESSGRGVGPAAADRAGVRRSGRGEQRGVDDPALRAQMDQPLDLVAQLAHVAGPGARDEALQGAPADAAHRLVGALRRAAQEVLHQHRHVLARAGAAAAPRGRSRRGGSRGPRGSRRRRRGRAGRRWSPPPPARPPAAASGPPGGSRRTPGRAAASPAAAAASRPPRRGTGCRRRRGGSGPRAPRRRWRRPCRCRTSRPPAARPGWRRS